MITGQERVPLHNTNLRLCTRRRTARLRRVDEQIAPPSGILPTPPPDAIARTDHLWESLGFVRVAGQLFVRDESLIHEYASDRAITLGLSALSEDE